MKKISILIIDDHILLNEAWAAMLNADGRFDVIDSCGTAEKGLERVATNAPDLVLMDINLPGIDGIQATEMILQMNKSIKILGVSSHNQPHYAYKMMRKGASGYVSKFAPKEELLNAILEVLKGNKYICNSIKDVLADEMMNGNETEASLKTLTRRELEIIKQIKKGASSKEVAAELFLSVKTIEVHRYNILKKLGLKNTASLVNYIHNSMAFS